MIVLGVNLGAWTLSVATGSSPSVATLSVPISAPAIDARSQAASVELTQTPIMNADDSNAIATTTATTTANP